jgi:hypothetical protein
MFKIESLPLFLATATCAVVVFGAQFANAAPPAPTASVPSPSRSQARLEAGITTIGDLANDARAEEDIVRLNCVLDKRDRAGEVMNLADLEMLVIRDRNAGDQARTFAAEKLSAAADRLDGLVEAARACAGDQAPEDRVDATRTEAAEPKTIPVNDPAAAADGDGLPPVLDPAWLPVASGSQ